MPGLCCGPTHDDMHLAGPSISKRRGGLYGSASRPARIAISFENGAPRNRAADWHSDRSPRPALPTAPVAYPPARSPTIMIGRSRVRSAPSVLAPRTAQRETSERPRAGRQLRCDKKPIKQPVPTPPPACNRLAQQSQGIKRRECASLWQCRGLRHPRLPAKQPYRSRKASFDLYKGLVR